MRIISGSAKGRRLKVPESGTRPIPDRAKTGIFNMILSLRMAEGTPGLQGVRVLDLFAGAGSFGLECLSRGAAEVVFVEQNRAAARVLEHNLATIGCADRARILVRDVASVVASFGPDASFDLAFCDPPYADDPWDELLPLIPADVLVAHSEGELHLSPEWRELRRRSYGRPQVVLAKRAG
ncbi:MAG: RsmD family RNA methyltransferase [Acidimicrobiia bacterium]|nr:RsmD family RNA methyltransferase [Acidimicrobiia bacterium]